MRCCIHKGQWIIIKKEITACTPMWWGVKCSCRPLCQLPHWLTFRLSPFCTRLSCIYYTLFKLFFLGCPKLRCFKALKSLDLMKRMGVFGKIGSSGDTGGLLHLSRTDSFPVFLHPDMMAIPTTSVNSVLISNSLNMVDTHGFFYKSVNSYITLITCFWLCWLCAFLYCNTYDGTCLPLIYVYCDTLNPGFKKQTYI